LTPAAAAQSHGIVTGQTPALRAGWGIKSKSTTMIFLGKCLFPSQPPWQQRKSLLAFFGALAVGIAVGGCVIAFILLQGHRR